MKDRSGFAAVNGSNLYYELAGSGDPLVLLHGLGLDRRMWDPQRALLSHRHRVLRYDLRGFGRSQLPGTERYSHAKDLVALLHHLRISRPVTLVGFSFGGSVALRVALDHPELVRNLILVDSDLNGHRWSSAWRSRMAAIDRAAASGGASAANRMWLDGPLFAPAREDRSVGRALAAMVGTYTGWHWLHDDPQEPRSRTDLSLLSTVSTRTLILLGERDLPDFHSIAAELQAGIRDATRQSILGAGHVVNMEAPAEFVRRVLDFDAGRPD